MSKRPFFIFLIVALICLIALPIWALARKGNQSASPIEVASQYKSGQQLFQINCGACHTLQAAGTDGVIGPNLDVLFGTAAPSASTIKATKTTVLSTIQQGLSGRMPAGIVQGAQADEVADFVANNVEYLPGGTATTPPSGSSSTTSGG